MTDRELLEEYAARQQAKADEVPFNAIVLGVMFVVLLLGMMIFSGCAFLEQVERNRVMWNGYVNSPAYHQTIHTTTVDTAMGTTQCTTICDRYDCVVRCR